MVDFHGRPRLGRGGAALYRGAGARPAAVRRGAAAARRDAGARGDQGQDARAARHRRAAGRPARVRRAVRAPARSTSSSPTSAIAAASARPRRSRPWPRSRQCGVAPAQSAGPDRRRRGAAFRRLHAQPSSSRRRWSGAVPWYFEVVRGPIRMVDGCWQVPEAPGLGIEVDEARGRPAPLRAGGPAHGERRAAPTARWWTGDDGGPAAGQGRDRHRRRPRHRRGHGARHGRRGCQGRDRRAGPGDGPSAPRAELGGLFVRLRRARAGAAASEVAARTLEAFRPDRHPGRQCRHQRLPRAAGDARGGVAALLRGRPRRRLAFLPRRCCRPCWRRAAARSSRSPPATASPSSRTPSPIRSPSTACSASCGRWHRVRGQGRARERDRARLHRDPDRGRLLEHLPRPAGRAAEGLRPASAQARSAGPRRWP